jgi:hypothetical protein
MNLAVKFGCFAVLVFHACLSVGAQAALSTSSDKTVPKPPSAATFQVDVNLVLVEVGVHDEHGRAVGILKQPDFHVFEEGKEQVISTFAHEELP